MPDTPKGPALTEIKEIVRLEPPTLLIVTTPLTVVPTVALPKFKLAGLTLICWGAVVAVADSATCSEATPVSVIAVKLPVAFPADVALNET